MTVTDAFRRAADAFGKPEYTLHTLRHAAASGLLTSGADLRTTSSILGYTDAATTLRVYSHVVSERQHSAAALIGDVLAGISRNGDWRLR
jgi:site-specific recombinase XerD